jgi:hypothetical protein
MLKGNLLVFFFVLLYLLEISQVLYTLPVESNLIYLNLLGLNIHLSMPIVRQRYSKGL